ncbi:MAG: tRNA (N6-threonylcarbamoyladenosine(37)-N6)-methyltransferase TrmO [Proteobacteria bacterium]|nr:tRNA (N6-threonylcarbamoyladenosine(37)-N6)-methyltransferase TrmO [Pseudomonadota bacterium]MBU1739793.1 tRNA (N6-threonylcarbamoyladenosine(37)-N6)-methyltransferase TrmO [Pseudomonadota bacterium]
MPPPEEISIKPIGVMHCNLNSREQTPRNYDISEETGTLEIFPEFSEALHGIKIGQTIVCLFWLHEARRDILKVYPRGDKSRGLQGVFATRSPVRPNPVAISEYRVTGIAGNEIEVSGVDVLDQTPLIDIKKKI